MNRLPLTEGKSLRRNLRHACEFGCDSKKATQGLDYVKNLLRTLVVNLAQRPMAIDYVGKIEPLGRRKETGIVEKHFLVCRSWGSPQCDRRTLEVSSAGKSRPQHLAPSEPLAKTDVCMSRIVPMASRQRRTCRLHFPHLQSRIDSIPSAIAIRPKCTPNGATNSL
jgi:hypothetical protein